MPAKRPRPAPSERRASRRSPVEARIEFWDTRGRFPGRTVDVSRGGLFAVTADTRPVGTLLRVRLVGPRAESVMAVGVVVRCFPEVEKSTGGGGSPGIALAITSTSEAWDRFWDDVTASKEFDDEPAEDASEPSRRRRP